MARLGDLCRFINGDRGKNYPSQAEISSDGDVPFINAGHLVDGKLDFSDMNYISEEKYNQLNSGKIQENDVLYCLRGSLGKKAIIKGISKGAIASSLVIIRPDARLINSDYLFYALESPTVQEQMMQANNGSSQPNLSAKSVSDYTFNLPTINKQCEIVLKLAKVNDLISLRKEQLAKLDQLVKSRFIELFSDCENTIRLGECCEVHARIGWQALKKEEHMKTGEYMLVTGTDFKGGEINYSTCVYVEKERYEMDKHIILKNDDVLITKDGTIGKVAIVHNLPKPATLNAGVFVVRPDERFNKEYIANVFKGPLFSDYVEASKTGATIKHLNQKHLVEFMIPVPTLTEQESFAHFTQQTDKSKLVVQQSLEKLETLKKALMQKYFG